MSITSDNPIKLPIGNLRLVLSTMLAVSTYGFFIGVYDTITGLDYNNSDFTDITTTITYDDNNNIIQETTTTDDQIQKGSKITGRIILTALLVGVCIFFSIFSYDGQILKYELVLNVGIIIGIMFLMYQIIRRYPEMNAVTKPWIRALIFGLLSIILGFIIYKY